MAEVTVQPSAKDTLLLLSSPTSNYGTNVDIGISDRVSYTRRIIIEFSLSTIPVGQTISSALLYLYYYRYAATNPSGKSLSVHKLSRSNWVESQSTWNIYKTSSNWATSGGDYESANPTPGTALFPGSYGWVSIDVTAITEEAYSNSVSAEFLVKFTTEGLSADYTSYADFYSKDYTDDTSKRPKLIITYTSGTTRPIDALTRVTGQRIIYKRGPTERETIYRDELYLGGLTPYTPIQELVIPPEVIPEQPNEPGNGYTPPGSSGQKSTLSKNPTLAELKRAQLIMKRTGGTPEELKRAQLFIKRLGL